MGKKNDIEDIFHHKIATGRGNNQYLNFKSNILPGQMKYMLGTSVFRQGRIFVICLKNILKKHSLLLYTY